VGRTDTDTLEARMQADAVLFLGRTVKYIQGKYRSLKE
jgi:hypothetical protein